jgi:Ser/Thr protein kinase RdoA (MazF antagonist)
MSGFYELSPQAQVACIQRLVEENLHLWGFGADAVVRLLKYRENAVFAVTDGAQRFALRVHRAGYHSDKALRSELQWMEALNRDGIQTPAVVPAVDGEMFKVVSGSSVPEPRQVDVLEWINGEPLGSVEEGANGDPAAVVANYRVAGELMAKLHNHAQRWLRPEGFVRHAWDIDGIVGDDPLWGRYWELQALSEDQRALVHRAREKARAELLEFGQQEDRYGLIHCDFLPENLLRTQDGIQLIDFDDAGSGWHLFDIATSLFFLQGEQSFEAVLDSFLTGYRSFRPLPAEHEMKLPLFLLLRGLVYLGWAHTRRETETAQALTPMLTESVMAQVEHYLEAV